MDIWEAAEEGDVERVRVLVEHDAGMVHAQEGWGRTPLFHAAQYGHIGVVRYLLDAGADIDHPDHLQVTVLHIACREGYAAVVSLLLQRGADTTMLTDLGFTALSLAAFDGRDAIVDLLLEHDLYALDAVNNAGDTALHGASSDGHDRVVTRLLQAGADSTLRDADDRTSIDVAEDDGSLDCVRVLQAQ